MEESINLNEKEELDIFWLNCSHSGKWACVTIQAKDPTTFFVCCIDCYDRLLGSFIREATQLSLKTK